MALPPTTISDSWFRRRYRNSIQRFFSMQTLALNRCRHSAPFRPALLSTRWSARALPSTWRSVVRGAFRYLRSLHDILWVMLTFYGLRDGVRKLVTPLRRMEMNLVFFGRGIVLRTSCNVK